MTSQTPGRHHGALAGLDQVVAPTLEAVDLGAGRHQDQLVLPPRPVLLLAPPVTATSGAEVPRAVQRAQIAPRGVADQHHVSPAAPVAPVRAAARHVGLAAKAHAAVAAAPPST